MEDSKELDWSDFLSKSKEFAEHEPERWTPLSLLSYFILSYEKMNGVEYIFTPSKRGPTKCKEMKDAAKIWQSFDRGRYKALKDPEEKKEYKRQLVAVLKEYIDWMFNVKMRGRATNVTGLGLFVVTNVMNEFLQWRKKNKNKAPRRGTAINRELIEWAKATVPAVFERHQVDVYDDLNVLIDYVAVYSLPEHEPEHQLIQKAREMGLLPREGKLELASK